MAWIENEKDQISAGPWGGQYGCRWDDGVYYSVRQVIIASSAAIDSIRFEYDNKGFSVWSEKHGGGGGVKLDKIKLDHPNEHLVSISGHCGPLSDLEPVVVRSLFFESNRKKYGPFGIQQGTSFSLPVFGGKLVGFHGRSSWYLDSIGVYVKPLIPRNPTSTTMPANPVNYPKPEAMNSRKVVSHGPWGGSGGTKFDDGIYTGVRGISITRTGGLVSIRVCYDQHNTAVWGEKNGRTGGLNKDKIVFDYPSELLTHITGYYASTILRGPTIIKSITFHTNRRSYGPFGDQQGVFFSSGSKEGVIVGFHGRRGYFVDSIGVHVLEMKPLIPAKPSNKIDQKPYEEAPVARETGPWSKDGRMPRDTDPYEPGPWVRDGGKPRVSEPLELSPWGRNERSPWSRNGEKPRETGSQGPGPWAGDGGKPWDDGVYTGIRKILITLEEVICSIQIEYDRNGQSVWSAQHGHGNNACTYIIKFDYPHEILTNVSGYYGGSSRVIRSLTFYTNVAKYGPFGEEKGDYFSSAKTEGKVVGFHGKSGVYLDAIGVHMQQEQKQWMGNESSYQLVAESNAMRAALTRILV